LLHLAAMAANGETFDETFDGTLPTHSPRALTCADNDAAAVSVAASLDVTIADCADAGQYCEHDSYGSTVKEYCPDTCGLCGGPVNAPAAAPTAATPGPTAETCADNDAEAVSGAASLGMEIADCADAGEYCEDDSYGSALKEYCPDTCGLCGGHSNRVANGSIVPQSTFAPWLLALAAAANGL